MTTPTTSVTPAPAMADQKAFSSAVSRSATVPANFNPPVPEGFSSEVWKSLTAVQKNALLVLDEVNGQDAYSNAVAALGKLKVEEYLALPIDTVIPPVDPKDVGNAEIYKKFDKVLLAQIYVLNKDRAPAGEDAVKYGLARMEAVKMGWYDGQSEVVRLAPPADAIMTFTNDIAANINQVDFARQVAFLTPFTTEHTFRTFGHHYISGQAAEYNRRYMATFKACLVPELFSWMNPSTMFHHAFHWIGPARIWSTVKALFESPRLPEAIRIRASAAPAGTAIVTTTVAAIRAMESSGLAKEIIDTGVYDLKTIRDMDALIHMNPPKYHKTFYAYSVAPPSDSEKAQFETAKIEAIKFAPIAQAFIDSLFKNAALGRARALAKHADDNPVLKRQASRYFSKVGHKDVAAFKDLMATGAKADENEDE